MAWGWVQGTFKSGRAQGATAKRAAIRGGCRVPGLSPSTAPSAAAGACPHSAQSRPLMSLSICMGLVVLP